jgi:hypothetical protein
MTVEDGVALLAECVDGGLYVDCARDDWAVKFVRNVATHVSAGKALSTEQARIILNLLRRSRNEFVLRSIVGVRGVDLDRLLKAPTYRQPPYASANVPREVRYLGDNCLGFRFKRDDTISSDLKALVRDQDFGFEDIWFHPMHRLWVVPINRDTIAEAMALISRHRFSFDDGVADFLAAASDATGQPSSVSTDPELGLTAVQVRDNEVAAWIVASVLRGQPV